MTTEQPPNPKPNPKGKPKQPWERGEYPVQVVMAVQSLATGSANTDQQKLALRYIIEELAAAYDLSYRPGPDGDRDTVFAEGKRFIGLQLVRMVKLNVSKLRRD